VSREAETLELRQGIERTRTEMSATIDAIQEQLNPQHIAEQVREQVRHQFDEAKATVRDATLGKAEAIMRDAGDTMNEARYSLMDTVRQNPIPAAMVGIGLGWLFMNRNSGRPRHMTRYDERYRGRMVYAPSHPAYPGEAMAMYPAGRREDEGMIERGQRRVGETAHRAQEATGEAVSRAQEAVGGAAHRVQDAAGSAVNRVQDAAGSAVNRVQDVAEGAAHRVQDMSSTVASQTAYQTRRAEDRLRQALRENPIGVGAVALAIGTAVGLAIPETERERQLMGEARDSLVERAQEAAAETIDKVQRVAEETLHSAEETATQKSKEVGLTSDQKF
jgi:ElaB/YqjD/DUF883 family membrane-anchored ribosome-binding protein